MRRLDASLGRRGWCHVKVELLVAFVLVHDQLRVNDTACWWISQPTLTIFDEEALVDPLIGNDKSDFWHLVVDSVGLCNRFLELGHLSIEDLLPLSITNPISINDEVSWELSTILLLEGSNSILESLFHLRLNNLLASFLDQILAVILTHWLIDRGCKPNDGSWAGMAHINPDQHGSKRFHRLWELHLVQVTTSLNVDLLQHVACFRQPKLLSIPPCHYLRRYLISLEYLLDHGIIPLICQYCHNNYWMAENAVLALHHVV